METLSLSRFMFWRCWHQRSSIWVSVKNRADSLDRRALTASMSESWTSSGRACSSTWNWGNHSSVKPCVQFLGTYAHRCVQPRQRDDSIAVARRMSQASCEERSMHSATTAANGSEGSHREKSTKAPVYSTNEPTFFSVAAAACSKA